jgi:hydrogenase maturation protease
MERGLQSASAWELPDVMKNAESNSIESRSGLKPALLVIGYGNTLRSDDGVGPRVAEAVGALGLPGVRTLICQQLSPEHADPISQTDRVVFVDAAVGEPRAVQFRELEPGTTTQLMAHAADPRTMLALARDVFGHAPRAWWLTIPAVNLEFSETLSVEAERGCEAAIKHIRELYNSSQAN